MKRFYSALTGLAIMASASGCCCDCCNMCNPCGRPTCSTGCPGGPPTAGYLSPSAPAVGLSAPVTTTTAMPATYYGSPVATAAVVPMESLPTY
jgi:hypothetical protein